MSHVDTGFAVKDIEAMRQTIEQHCPQLELVEQNTYRTWITDHGSLAGDAPLPGIYQLQMLLYIVKTYPDFNITEAAASLGVTLPADLTQLETTPWTVEQEQELLEDKTFQAAYDHVCQKIIGKDATYVIRMKDNNKQHRSMYGAPYEIGLVPNPLRPDEFSLVTDYYSQGYGLLKCEGVGQANDAGEWGQLLKLNYSVVATERHIQQGISSGDYRSYTRQPLPEGGFRYDIVPNSR